MKFNTFILPLLIFLCFQLNAQKLQDQNFQSAYNEISAMLERKQPLDFERAVFLTENAYRDNVIAYEDFKAALDVSTETIRQLIKANDQQDWRQYIRGTKVTPARELQVKERYQRALSNWAIYTWMTDTVEVRSNGQSFSHLPLTYSNDDPFGTTDWKNSQILNLFESGKGNCYSLVTLFKIFSERLKSEATIVTAPQHIYIEHLDPNGNRFNVELATKSFPNMGSIQTLTYTTHEGLRNDISMRSLDLKQSVGLCLIYLAKGYQYKYNVSDDEFLLSCANKALQYDARNLNALLLKAQVYEQRVIKGRVEAAPYETLLTDLYKLGYRQMPDDMKEVILSRIQGRQTTTVLADKNPNPYLGIGEQSRYVTLSNGLFDEIHQPQRVVRYGRTIFDTEKNKIVKFLNEDISSYQVDPVVFALSVDPLTKSYPELTPYQFASNRPIDGIDLDGLEYVSTSNPPFHQMQFIYELGVPDGKKRSTEEMIQQAEQNQHAWTKGIVAGAALNASVIGGHYFFWRASGLVYANPELLVGMTGLTASLVDPNPASDYPGNFDDAIRGAKLLLKNSTGAERFIFNTNRLNFFFGRGTGTEKNIQKSIQRAKDFTEMGFTEDASGVQKLLNYMNKAVDLPAGTAKKNPVSGKFEVWKTVEVTEGGKNKGAIQFGFSYTDEAMKTTPEVTTAIPQVNKSN